MVGKVPKSTAHLKSLHRFMTALYTMTSWESALTPAIPVTADMISSTISMMWSMSSTAWSEKIRLPSFTLMTVKIFREPQRPACQYRFRTYRIWRDTPYRTPQRFYGYPKNSGNTVHSIGCQREEIYAPYKYEIRMLKEGIFTRNCLPKFCGKWKVTWQIRNFIIRLYYIYSTVSFS